MPPKQNYTKEDILQAAYTVMKRNGFETINARSLAKELGCSTQPIYSYFADMEALKEDLYEYAVNRFMGKVNLYQDAPDFLIYANRIFIKTALQDSHLFRFIYLSHSCDGESLYDLLTKYESNRLILSRLCKDYDLPPDTGRTVFYKIWFFVFGIAAMLCTNRVDINDEEIFGLVSETIRAVITDAKKGEQLK